MLSLNKLLKIEFSYMHTHKLPFLLLSIGYTFYHNTLNLVYQYKSQLSNISCYTMYYFSKTMCYINVLNPSPRNLQAINKTILIMTWLHCFFSINLNRCNGNHYDMSTIHKIWYTICKQNEHFYDSHSIFLHMREREGKLYINVLKRPRCPSRPNISFI